jgi:hypothetical protein
LAVVGLGTNLAAFSSISIFIFSSILFFFVVKVGFEVFHGLSSVNRTSSASPFDKSTSLSSPFFELVTAVASGSAVRKRLRES